MALGLTKKEKELVKGALLSAIHKMIKQLQQGTIKCNYLGEKFKITFYTGEPNGKFNDRTPIAYNLSIQEVLSG